jgi:hypothetical protein
MLSYFLFRNFWKLFGVLLSRRILPLINYLNFFLIYRLFVHYFIFVSQLLDYCCFLNGLFIDNSLILFCLNLLSSLLLIHYGLRPMYNLFLGHYFFRCCYNGLVGIKQRRGIFFRVCLFGDSTLLKDGGAFLRNDLPWNNFHRKFGCFASLRL